MDLLIEKGLFMDHLFTKMKLRDCEFKNRVWMPPMCQYSAKDGVAQPWHFVHYGARAVGGVGAIIIEATAVSPEGRISYADLGLWNDEQSAALKPIVHFIQNQNVKVGIQLAHAGRKASTDLAWNRGGALSVSQGGWEVVAPSSVPFAANYSTPKELTKDGLIKIKSDFLKSAKRALQIGCDFIEIHMAHGYLLHEFLSPLSNQRKDQYGDSLENRMKFPLEIAKELREFWPQNLPVLVRISATDWVENGWDLEQSLIFAERLKSIGIDLIDCSSGGTDPNAKIPNNKHYQVPFASEIKRKVTIPTSAVGLITDPVAANELIEKNECDVVMIGRELLRNPNWPLYASKQLNQEHTWPNQYLRSRN